MESGNFNVSDICGVNVINEQAENDTSYVAGWCITLCLAVFTISFFTICEMIGCFENSCWCKNKCVSLLNKLFEVIIWCTLLIISTTLVENTASSGWRSTWPNNANGVAHLASDLCELTRQQIVYISFELDIPIWLKSDGYQAIAMIGVGLSIIEFALFFMVFFCAKRLGLHLIDDDKPEMTVDNNSNMEKEIELGDNMKDNTDQGQVNGNTTNIYGTVDNNGDGDIELETGNASEHDSDDDVIYDDEEKEMEYVTPGGPTPQ